MRSGLPVEETDMQLPLGGLPLEMLDLSKVKRKLMLPASEGQEWCEHEASEAEKWYRRFLSLRLSHPGVVAVPNAPIDAFWHAHILDTRKYAEDCDHLFGEILHHYPYFGLNGDEGERDEAFEKTNEAYRTLYGEDCTTMFTGAHAMGCGHKGSGTGCGQGCSRGK